MVLAVAVDGGVLELTLDRPEALNAFTADLHGELARALRDARKPAVRAVIVTGAGRAFCAGQDLAEAQGSSTGPGARLQQLYNPNILAIRTLEKPVIAALNGVAAGAGMALALACDLRIASETASLVPAFVGIGLVPDSGSSWFATRMLGEARAYDWLTSGRRLGAAEALEWGLVNEVVAPGDLLARARRRAADLAATPGEAAGMTKRLLRAAMSSTLEEQLELERQLQQVASEHPAYAERVAAFLERSSPGTA